MIYHDRFSQTPGKAPGLVVWRSQGLVVGRYVGVHAVRGVTRCKIGRVRLFGCLV